MQQNVALKFLLMWSRYLLRYNKLCLWLKWKYKSCFILKRHASFLAMCILNCYLLTNTAHFAFETCKLIVLGYFLANKESRANLRITDFQRCKIWDQICGNSSLIIGPQPFLSHLQHSSGLITSLFFSPAAKHLRHCNLCFFGIFE